MVGPQKWGTSNPYSDNRSIAEILGKDISLTAQIYRICNSTFFGKNHEINDLPLAISMLGISTLKSMTLLNGFFSAFNGSKHIKQVLLQLCNNSLSIASVTHTIAKESGFNDVICDQATSAGTLSHIGSLIIAITWPEHFTIAAQMAEKTNKSIDIHEREILGSDHAIIGSYLLGLWGFSFELCEAVAYHHRPNTNHDIAQPILASLHLAQQLTKVFDRKKINLQQLEKQLDSSFLSQQNITLSPEKWALIVQNNLTINKVI